MPNHNYTVSQNYVGLNGADAGIVIGGNHDGSASKPKTDSRENDEAHNNVQPSIVVNRATKF